MTRADENAPLPDDPTGGIGHLMSFGGANDNSGLENTIYRGTLHAFTDFVNGTKFGDAAGFGGGSGGITKAAYTTWDGTPEGATKHAAAAAHRAVTASLAVAVVVATPVAAEPTQRLAPVLRLECAPATLATSDTSTSTWPV